MKKNILILTLLTLLIGQLTTLQAQTLFLEDFETSPVTSIYNLLGGDVPDGPSPCGKASRGNTGDLNSSSVDFLNAENGTYFLGVNPHSPCGGFYIARLKADSLDFSSQDSLRFKCRYFKSTTVGWGATSLQITISSLTSSFIINSQFSVTGSWTNLDIALPSSLISYPVSIDIEMGGGEGVGLDDVEVVNIPSTTTGLEQYNVSDNIKFYPNPFSSQTILQTDNVLSNATLTVYNSFGQIVKQVNNISGQTAVLTRDNLASGLYFIRLTEENKSIATDKLILY